jgi:hypothetical protein
MGKGEWYSDSVWESDSVGDWVWAAVKVAESTWENDLSESVK